MSDSPKHNPGPHPAAGADPAAAAGRQVLLQKIYVKDASIEVPQGPAIFTRAWRPEVDVQVNTKVDELQQDSFQVQIVLTVTAKLAEDVAFLVEAHQAGIFTVKGFDNAGERASILGGYCPSLIFPFARETIADLVQRAGFPQLLLQPINFEALFLEHQRKRQAEAATADTPATTH